MPAERLLTMSGPFHIPSVFSDSGSLIFAIFKSTGANELGEFYEYIGLPSVARGDYYPNW